MTSSCISELRERLSTESLFLAIYFGTELLFLIEEVRFRENPFNSQRCSGLPDVGGKEIVRGPRRKKIWIRGRPGKCWLLD
uniref:Uncharacterized protein n=1 Tax=Utricularia reniformis TaxID=192314 RepID=A0A1Y0B4L5_9LAMI|nr:hypothetical protein AEK19_MT2250 [Utricularia reniformis]ART32395.1 hypothetical protein AEK19_MT2250 [Utricularia reniformis]